MQILVEGSRNLKATPLMERAESQSAMLRNGNVPHVLVGGARHQKRRVVNKEGGAETATPELADITQDA